MKVLHIGLCSKMGGIESFALNYFSKLRQQGVIFDFADLYGAGIAGAERIAELGGAVYILPNYKRHPIQTFARLTKLLKEGHYDAVHINTQSAANILPILAAQKAGVVPVVHGHIVSAEGALRAFLHRVNLGVLRKTPAIRLACSNQAGEWLWGNAAFRVIPNAVDLGRYTFSETARLEIRSRLSVSEDTVLLGYVGRLEPVKNPLYAVRLLEECRKAKPAVKIKLLVLGEGSLRKQMEAEIEAYGIADAVILAGVQQNVAQYLSAMDAFLMPSLHEALSLAAVEAQASGLCCLFSDSITQELKILETAVFLPLEDMDAWTAQICALSPQNGCGRVEAVRAVENAGFSIDKSAEALMEVYRQAMAANGR